MLKMSGFEALFSTLGSLYLLLALVAVCIAIWKGKTGSRKLIYAGVVLAVFIVPIAPEIYCSIEYRGRLAKAEALFDERCKSAGTTIHKTVDGVDGVLLLNVRSGRDPSNEADPRWVDAALPNESGGDQYIRNFLYWEHNDGKNERGVLNSSAEGATSKGYRFVDVKQLNGTVLRYRLKSPQSAELEIELVQGLPARYAVSFTNQTDPEDRRHWVAGTSIKVTDARTGEVMGERRSYAFEPGLGSKAGNRQPWAFAIACRPWKGWDGAQTRFFVEQVLRPIG